MLQPASCKNLAVVKYEFLVVPSTSIIVSGNVTGDFSYSRYGVIYIYIYMTPGAECPVHSRARLQSVPITQSVKWMCIPHPNHQWERNSYIHYHILTP